MRKPASRAILRKDDLIQEGKTVVPVHDHWLPSEAKLLLERPDLVFKYPVFVIQIRHIGHHEVKSNALFPWLVRFRSNVSNHLGKSPQVLLVRKEQNHHRIRKLPGADSACIRVSSAGVDQHVVRLYDLVPLLLEIFEQQKSVVPFVQRAPVDLIEFRSVGLVPARRHDPESAALVTDSGAFADEAVGGRSLSVLQVLGNEVDDSRDLFTRPQHVEGVKPGRLHIKIHDKYAAAAEGERDGDVDQSHRAADAALE